MACAVSCVKLCLHACVKVQMLACLPLEVCVSARNEDACIRAIRSNLRWYVRLSVSICHSALISSVSQSVSPQVSPPVHLSVRPAVRLSDRSSVLPLFVRPPLHPSVRQPVRCIRSSYPHVTRQSVRLPFGPSERPHGYFRLLLCNILS